jgi:hypothetical protein
VGFWLGVEQQHHTARDDERASDAQKNPGGSLSALFTVELRLITDLRLVLGIVLSAPP